MDSLQRYNITDWCGAIDISEQLYFHLRRKGQAPKSVKLGRKVVIIESPDAYLIRCAETQSKRAVGE